MEEKQHVQPLQRDRLDGEEVVGDDAARLLTQKLAPRQHTALRRRLDVVTAQDPPDRARRDPEPKKSSPWMRR
jgi:hypothetical protein